MSTRVRLSRRPLSSHAEADKVSTSRARSALRLVLCLTAIFVVSCGDVVCAGVGLPAVAVTIFDAQTGARAAAGASLILRSPACTDTVVGVADDQVLAGCDDREGTYTVTVSKPGYRDWTQSTVEVRDTCSLETRRFDVRLEPLP